jgi:hypothetical protein
MVNREHMYLQIATNSTLLHGLLCRFVGSKQRYTYVATMVTGFGAAVK